MEEDEDKETWERTRWTWESDTCNMCGHTQHEDKHEHNVQQQQVYDEVFDARHNELVLHNDKENDELDTNIIYREVMDNSDKICGIRNLDLLEHVISKQGDGITRDSDDELEDYYENHKAWPK